MKYFHQGMTPTVEPLLPVSATRNCYNKEHGYSAETRDFSRKILNNTDEWTKEVKLFSNCSYREEESSSHAELSKQTSKAQFNRKILRYDLQS